MTDSANHEAGHPSAGRRRPVSPPRTDAPKNLSHLAPAGSDGAPGGGIRQRLRDVTEIEGVSQATGRSRVDRASDDAELMEALGRGDVASLESLYDRYSTLVFSVSLRVLHDAHLAEDVTQEVFVRLWRQPASFDPARGRFISWLMSVTRNRALDELRRVSRRNRSEDAESDDAPIAALATSDRMDDPELGAELAEQREAVRAAMTRLPPEQRRAIELAYFSGLTQVEIAGVTGDPLGTVKTRIRLGMRKLRESLTEYVAEYAEDDDPAAERPDATDQA